MMTERQRMKCEKCGGSGMKAFADRMFLDIAIGEGSALCPTCRGSGKVLESERAWALRCKGIARELAKNSITCELGETVGCKETCHYWHGKEPCIQARINAAAKATKGGER